MTFVGHKLDAMICDGDSRELSASTVVNCMKIDQGKMSNRTAFKEYISFVDRMVTQGSVKRLICNQLRYLKSNVLANTFVSQETSNYQSKIYFMSFSTEYSQLLWNVCPQCYFPLSIRR